MLYIQDKIIKLGGMHLPGAVESIEISHAANIDEIENEKKNTKKYQATGYDPAKINITIELEDTKEKTTLQQLKELQRLFKTAKQKNSKVIKIINEDCIQRGISKVYFKSFTHKKVIAESRRTVNIELWEYTPVTVITKKAVTKSSTKTESSSKTGNAAETTVATSSSTTVSKKYNTYLNTSRGKAPKIKSKKDTTPSKDTAGTGNKKKTASKLVR